MRKLLSMLLCGVCLVALLCSCTKDDPYKTYDVSVQLVYPAGSEFTPVEGVTVNARNVTTDMLYTGTTDASGIATIAVVAGIYEFTSTETRAKNGTAVMFNGLKTGITVTKEWKNNPQTVSIELVETEAKQIIIKEVYVGGCPKNDGSGSFANDKYIVLYNNSEVDADLTNLCFAIPIQYNSYATNVDYVDGVLSYESEHKVPAGHGLWTWGTETPKLKPGEQVVVAMTGAINNTLTYNYSVDLSKSDYYAMYDPESGYNNAAMYPTPSENIATAHYLKAYRYGAGSGWTISVASPSFFIFITPEGVTPQSFFEDTSNENLYNNLAAMKRKWVPSDWVVDAVEGFKIGEGAKNKKRLITEVDAGSIAFINTKGYTIYRNVNKEATEAIAGNTGKIVYGYSGGTTDIEEGTTDPSGIDAEASIQNGAHIIFMDTNNSTNDYHLRKEAALRK
ncbi:MAG: DUF4876 domain-containing protein [Bacteroidales bacterium]|nr:DUF4876 domain-containing protein [Bacteroidales bacterium]MDD3201255.1 DUF4876 domain-containing protein [Bacteroidales bacterium]